jgi:hypothetical protein
MVPLSKNISSQRILSMIAENNLTGWEILFDKYAAAMYTVICSLPMIKRWQMKY